MDGNGQGLALALWRWEAFVYPLFFFLCESPSSEMIAAASLEMQKHINCVVNLYNYQIFLTFKWPVRRMQHNTYHAYFFNSLLQVLLFPSSLARLVTCSHTTIFSTAVPITGTIQVFGCTTVVGQSDLMPDCTCYPIKCTTLIGLSCITERFRKCGGTKSSPGNAYR